ncbi:hypothetical protein BGZ68_004182, partial [Mortierella alpina]
MASKLPAPALAVAIPSTTTSVAQGFPDTFTSAHYSAPVSGTPSTSTPTSGMHSPPLSATVEDEAMEMSSASVATASKAPSGTIKAEQGLGPDRALQHHAMQSLPATAVQGSRENHAPRQPGPSPVVFDPINSSVQAANQHSLDLRQQGNPISSSSRQLEFASRNSKELAIQRVLEHGKVLK